MPLTLALLDPADALRFATQARQAGLALVNVEPANSYYEDILGISYSRTSDSLWDAGRLRQAIPYGRRSIETFGKIAAGFAYGPTNLAASVIRVASEESQLGDFSGAAASVAEAKALLNPTALRQLGPADRYVVGVVMGELADAAATIALEHGDFAAARRIVGRALAALPAAGLPAAYGGSQPLLAVEARADYALGDLSGAERAARSALMAAKTIEAETSLGRRHEASLSIWLSMALAREGKQVEAAQTIGPVVTMYRGLEKRNHGDEWLPLEFAEALYAQALSDAPHRAALLHEASGLVDHLIPAIAQLHDTREWRARIEAAQRTGGVR